MTGHDDTRKEAEGMKSLWTENPLVVAVEENGHVTVKEGDWLAGDDTGLPAHTLTSNKYGDEVNLICMCGRMDQEADVQVVLACFATGELEVRTEKLWWRIEEACTIQEALANHYNKMIRELLEGYTFK